MAAATSVQPLGPSGLSGSSRHLDHAGLPSSTSLERSASTSSSGTAHPLDASGQGEGKASSSTSSSPTYQSASSSSNHKTISTISTTISTANTAGSRSPPPPNSKPRVAGIGFPGEGRNVPAQSNLSNTNSNDYSWDSNDPLTRSKRDDDRSASGQRLLSSPGQDEGWNFARYRDEEEPYSPTIDEETPIQYPPVSEEDQEARAIEMVSDCPVPTAERSKVDFVYQNLGRWASEEKQRRKALRMSRTSSTLGAPPSAKLTKRLSALSILGTGKGSTQRDLEAGSSPTSGDSVKQESAASGDSWGDLDRGQRSDVASSEGDQDAKRAAKGKRREDSDPFRDPSVGSSLPRRPTGKPTARSPIVTPGRAPTIRHRAIERARETGETGQMPSIVATDADEEGEAVKQLQDMDINPFQSAAEVDEQRQLAMAREAARTAARTTILHGEEGYPPSGRMQMRKSMSSSKFNEIGLDDAHTVDWPEEADGSHPDGKHEARGARRIPWWSEWLCGCGREEDEEGEQMGRTCPE